MKIFKTIFFLTLFSSLISCGALNGGNCGSYGEWTYDKTDCKTNFWCFTKNQKATYKYYYRDKECKNGTVRQTKKEKVKCGC